MTESTNGSTKSTVQVPTQARNASNDVLPDTRVLLRELQVLPSETELKSAGTMAAALGGPPQSVALIESGATALSKWWAAGLGAAVLAAWPTIVAFWDDQPDPNRRVIVIGMSIATAAAVLAIGYIIGSDVRGRSAAAVATIEARARLADMMVRVADGAYRSPTDGSPGQVVALSPPLQVRLPSKSADDEPGWRAVAAAVGADKATEYLVLKGGSQEWVTASDVEFL